jgi:hypothetical protein
MSKNVNIDFFFWLHGFTSFFIITFYCSISEKCVYMVSLKCNLMNFILQLVRHSSSKSSNKKLQNLLTSMPRDTAHIQVFKKQRIKLKEKNSKYVPGSVSIQILGSGAVGSTASVYIFTDNSRLVGVCFSSGMSPTIDVCAFQISFQLWRRYSAFGP